MKRFTKMTTVIILMMAICISAVAAEKAEAKNKNIYFEGEYWFDGEYRKKIAKDEYYVLHMAQFTSPDGPNGNIYGNFSISYFYKPSGGMHPWKNGHLTHIGKNKYKSGKMRLRVYKKKIVIKKGGEYTGTYKLKKRSPQP